MCSLWASLIVKLALCPLQYCELLTPPDFTQVVLIWVLIDSSNLKILVPQNKKVNTWRHKDALYFSCQSDLVVCFYHCFRSSVFLTYTVSAALTYRLFPTGPRIFWCAALSSDREDYSWGSCRVQSIAREWPNELSWTNNWILNGLFPFTKLPFFFHTHKQKDRQRRRPNSDRKHYPIDRMWDSSLCACVRLQSAADQFVCLIRRIARARSSFISLLCLLYFSLNQTRTDTSSTDWAQSGQHCSCSSLLFYSYLFFFHNYRLCLFCQLAGSSRVYKGSVSEAVMFVCFDGIYLHSEHRTVANFQTAHQDTQSQWTDRETLFANWLANWFGVKSHIDCFFLQATFFFSFSSFFPSSDVEKTSLPSTHICTFLWLSLYFKLSLSYRFGHPHWLDKSSITVLASEPYWRALSNTDWVFHLHNAPDTDECDQCS